VRARARRYAKLGKRNPYRGAMARLRAEWGGRCHCSGCDECRRGPEGPCARRWRLHFAHVRPTPILATRRGRGRADRYHDIKRHPECYRLLCCWCHRQFDSVGGLPAPNTHTFGPPLELDDMEAAS
jgi:hypothetical protein